MKADRATRRFHDHSESGHVALVEFRGPMGVRQSRGTKPRAQSMVYGYFRHSASHVRAGALLGDVPLAVEVSGGSVANLQS
jgi:hypothetical protein